MPHRGCKSIESLTRGTYVGQKPIPNAQAYEAALRKSTNLIKAKRILRIQIKKYQIGTCGLTLSTQCLAAWQVVATCLNESLWSGAVEGGFDYGDSGAPFTHR